MSEYNELDLNKQCNIDATGVYRWKRTNNVVPGDILKNVGLSEAVLMVNDEARNEQITKSILEYREAQRNRGPEEITQQRAEACAAMGSGVEMVNVITGKHYTT